MVTTTQTSRLLNIASELRNIIYDYALAADGPIDISPSGEVAMLALLRVCRQSHGETKLLYYDTNTFKASVRDEETLGPLLWTKRIDKPSACAITAFVIEYSSSPPASEGEGNIGLVVKEINDTAIRLLRQEANDQDLRQTKNEILFRHKTCLRRWSQVLKVLVKRGIPVSSLHLIAPEADRVVDKRGEAPLEVATAKAWLLIAGVAKKGLTTNAA